MTGNTDECQKTPQLTLDDQQLKNWLKDRRTHSHQVGYLYANSICKVANLSSEENILFLGDPDRLSLKELKLLARKSLLKVAEAPENELNAAQVVPSSCNFHQATIQQITSLYEERRETLGRVRGSSISKTTALEVWADAGGRCMYEGCGEDLSREDLSLVANKVGYLAHIIASNPKGPRGDSDLSHKRANDPENIMLMCDRHHRRIDVFEREEHTVKVLQAMRTRHRDLVRTHLDALKYPRVLAVPLLANLAHIRTHFSDHEYREAILATRHAMLSGSKEFLRRDERDDRRSTEFWAHLLSQTEHDIRLLVQSVSKGDLSKDKLAIFPLHLMPILILAGRIIGEARSIQVFQFDRFTWKWDESATPKPKGTVRVEGLTGQQAEEVLLSIELTAELEPTAYPQVTTTGASISELPHIRIRTSNPNSGCIKHPDDLKQFRDIARTAINHIQDKMNASHIHLIPVSPASTVFCLGQMLQAGHHPPYTVYDRTDFEKPFFEALTITGTSVEAGHNNSLKRIEIR